MQNLTDVLSRYHFIDTPQNQNFYNQVNINPELFEKIVKITAPDVNVFLRQLKLYFYMTDSWDRIIPLRGIIHLDYRNSNNQWIPISVSNVEWTFNERYNQLIFSPLKIEPFQENNYEARIRFIPQISSNQPIKFFMIDPEMTVYVTTCPQNVNDCHNYILKTVSSLLEIADKSGIYNNTEYNGAVGKILPYLKEGDLSRWENQVNMNEMLWLRAENENGK
jgi:hypothetical protein